LKLARLLLGEAFAAIDRPALAGLKRQLGCLAALGTGRAESLAPAAAAETSAAASAALGFSNLPAGGTALGLVGVAFLGEELLVLDAEREGSAAIHALDAFFCVCHRITSSLNYWLA